MYTYIKRKFYKAIYFVHLFKSKGIYSRSLYCEISKDKEVGS